MNIDIIIAFGLGIAIGTILGVLILALLIGSREDDYIEYHSADKEGEG